MKIDIEALKWNIYSDISQICDFMSAKINYVNNNSRMNNAKARGITYAIEKVEVVERKFRQMNYRTPRRIILSRFEQSKSGPTVEYC